MFSQNIVACICVCSVCTPIFSFCIFALSVLVLFEVLLVIFMVEMTSCNNIVFIFSVNVCMFSSYNFQPAIFYRLIVAFILCSSSIILVIIVRIVLTYSNYVKIDK